MPVQGPDERQTARIEECPRVIDDVGEWSFFPRTSRREAMYIVGSADIDRYVTVPESAIGSIRTVIRLFDGHHTINEIETYFRDHERKRIDVAVIYGRFAQAGLIAASMPGARPGSELESMMLGVTDITLRPVSSPVRSAIVRAAPTAAIAGAAIIAWGSALALIDAVSLSGGTPSTLSVPLILLSCALHECAHGIAAIYYGLSPRRVRAAVFLGLVPFIYFRLGGLYTLAPVRRMVVWMAGIFANLTIASALVIALHAGVVGAGHEATARTVAVGNYMLALMNLVPFLPTDGYFVAMTLCRDHNLRGRAWRAMTSLLAGRWNGESLSVALYLVGGASTLGLLVTHRVLRAASGPHGGVPLAVGSLVLILCALATTAWREQTQSRWRRRAARSVRWTAIVAGLYLSGVLTFFLRFLTALVSADPLRRLVGEHQIALTLALVGAYAALGAELYAAGLATRYPRISMALARLLATAAALVSCALLLTAHEAGVALRAVWMAALVAWLVTNERLSSLSRRTIHEASSPHIEEGTCARP